jgi:hypothetical protein
MVISEIDPLGLCAAIHAPPVVIVETKGGLPAGTVATGVLTVDHEYQLLEPMWIATLTSPLTGYVFPRVQLGPTPTVILGKAAVFTVVLDVGNGTTVCATALITINKNVPTNLLQFFVTSLSLFTDLFI